ncbi:UvrD-helicase domain-containing protein [Leptospira santarosai]|uniref:UvrD-helicase domain-containing protein n=1 Tax=Leptospira santarosai TaxID=28183 RepID=UPI0002BF51CE|nr:UvrD-helicase domain-containing protein [Leptospira santarosai]EMP03409.1 AAA protein [Leptospira santarosai str. HAI1380]KXZ29004.1 DNA helicase II [Leptospira santarosai]
MKRIRGKTAEEASNEALEKIIIAIEAEHCFRLEAGAGAGKTYSLLKVIEYIVNNKSNQMMKLGHRVACITYTNVAKDLIRTKTDNNPLIYAETIHAFAWNLISGLQKPIREYVPEISQKWAERISEIGGIQNQIVKYDFGFPKATVDEITLHHDDVIKIFSNLLKRDKFKKLIKSKYPIILIDEYQDTNKELITSIVENIIEDDFNILIGFFGDHWQTIFGSESCGFISAKEGKILEVSKNANFRSDRIIVEMLNRIRPELIQNAKIKDGNGEIKIFHTNDWEGQRRKENHWQEDLPADTASKMLKKVVQELKKNGWDFNSKETKILMLTNNVLANEQGYSNLISAFEDSEEYLKKSNPYIKYLIDTVEEVCDFYINREYGEMFKIIGSNRSGIKRMEEKVRWHTDLRELIELRQTGTIQDVLKLLMRTKKPRISSRVENAEIKYNEYLNIVDPVEKQKNEIFYKKVSTIKAAQYTELIALKQYLKDNTPFSTKHGVKGEEFENVLVVCGRGWNHYNWNQFLEWANSKVPNGKEETYKRNRNLFYVSCSRSKRKLTVLFTQYLSKEAMVTLNHWFDSKNIKSLI